MLGVSLYIIACSFKNRVRRWLARLHEPRYLTLALAGGGYVAFLILLRLRSASMAGQAGVQLSPIDELPTLAVAGPTLAGFVLMTAAALSWMFPGGGLLHFTRAEVQFLFPGPVSRRTLVVYRMLRSQFGLLFGSFVSAVVLPSGSGPTRVRIGLTLWVLLFTAKVYFSGVTISRTRMASTDSRERWAGRLAAGAVVSAFLIVAVTLAPRLYASPAVGPAEFMSGLAQSSLPVVARALIWPFSALVHPLFATGWTSFLGQLTFALLVLAAVSAWVITSDDTFERVASAGGMQPDGRGVSRTYRGSKSGWKLAATGPPEMVFAWKAAHQTFRIVDRRVLVRIVAIVTWIAVVIVSSQRGQGLATVVGLFATTAAGMAVLIGPLTLRLDFRQDLQHLELLKTWPVPAPAAIRGMLLWPIALLTAIAWTMTLLALLLSASVFPDAPPSFRVAIAVVVMIVSPALIAAQLVIHNAAALAFPAWMATGGQRSRGLDAIGQRLFLVGGTILLLAVLSLPGALGGWAVWAALSPMIGLAALVPAALLFSATVAGEVLAAARALAPLYDALDLLAVERAEA